MSPKCSTILKTFLLSSLSCSQIWLNPLVNDGQPHLTNLKKTKKKTATWKLEACCVGSCGGGVAAASALLTSVLRASDVIDRRPMFPQLPRTSPWRLQHFASSTINWLILHLVYHYLITQAQLSDLIPVFEVADSSTREISQIFKGVEFGEFDLLTLGGKDLSPCLKEREREREKTLDWLLGFYFEGH
jgi:hypothetical protein